MSEYRRSYHPGGSYFFTLVTSHRYPWLCKEIARQSLREAIQKVRHAYPFEIEAFVLLPDHLHCLWRLTEGDDDFSIRWRLIKTYMSKHRESDWSPISYGTSHRKRHETNLWQRRFWEHLIRDHDDWHRHCDYIHYNPVKHHYCEAPRLWPYSSFHRYVQEGKYEIDWGSGPILPDFEGVGCE
jgi:putative transposase